MRVWEWPGTYPAPYPAPYPAIIDRPDCWGWRIPWRTPTQRAAIAHVATNSAAATLTTDDGVTVTTAATADGQVSFAWIANAGDVAITPPAGWTLISEFTGNGNRVWFGYRVASSDAGSYTWTWTDSRGIGIIIAFSGVDTTNPIFGWIPNAETSTSTHNVLGLDKVGTEPTAAMLLTCFVLNRGQTTTTGPTGYTVPANGNPDSTGTTAVGVEGAVAYKSFSSGSGIVATTWTTSNSAANNTVHLAMRASGDTQATVFAWPGYGTQAATNSLALPMPVGYRTGDLLIAVAGWLGDSNTASMSGWTQKGSTATRTVAGNDDHNVAVWYKYATSGSESGTIALSTSKAIAATCFFVRRTGTSGDPFADYQTTVDTTADTASDLAALTVTAQDMIVVGVSVAAGNAAHTEPTGYTPYGNPIDGIGSSRLYQRTGSASTNILEALAIKFQSAANPGATSFTISSGVLSVTAHGAIAIGSAATGGSSWLQVW